MRALRGPSQHMLVQTLPLRGFKSAISPVGSEDGDGFVYLIGDCAIARLEQVPPLEQIAELASIGNFEAALEMCSSLEGEERDKTEDDLHARFVCLFRILFLFHNSINSDKNKHIQVWTFLVFFWGVYRGDAALRSLPFGDPRRRHFAAARLRAFERHRPSNQNGLVREQSRGRDQTF